MAFILLLLHLVIVPFSINIWLDTKRMDLPTISLACLGSMAVITLLFFWSKILYIPFGILVGSSLITNLIYLYYQKSRWIHLNLIQKLKEKLKSIDNYNLAALVIMLIATLLFYRYHMPFGAWDAVAVWNMHASFLAENQHFFGFLEPMMYQSHPDYPLFIPSFIAAFWSTLGSKSAIIPTLFHLSILYLLLYSIWKTLAPQNKLVAVICLSIIALDRHFIARASSEYADTAIALIYLIAITSILFSDFINEKKRIALLAFIVASGAWIKNEGIVFLIIFIGVWIIKNSRTKSGNLKYLLLGASPVLLSLIYFKFQLAPENFILKKISISANPANLEIMDRLKIISSYFLKTLLKSFPVLLIGICTSLYILVKTKQKFPYYCLFLLSTTLAMYLLVYLFTPYDLEWHVKFSITRLIHHIYPATLVVFAYIISIFLNKKEAFIF